MESNLIDDSKLIDFNIGSIRRNKIGQYYTFEVTGVALVHFSIYIPRLAYDDSYSEKMDKILEAVPRNYVWYEYHEKVTLRDFFNALQTNRCEYKLRRVKVSKENDDIGPCGAYFNREVELECTLYDNPLPPEDPEEIDPRLVFCMTFYSDNCTSMYDCLCMLKEGFKLKDTKFLRSMLEHFQDRYAVYGSYRHLV